MLCHAVGVDDRLLASLSQLLILVVAPILSLPIGLGVDGALCPCLGQLLMLLLADRLLQCRRRAQALQLFLLLEIDMMVARLAHGAPHLAAPLTKLVSAGVELPQLLLILRPRRLLLRWRRRHTSLEVVYVAQSQLDSMAEHTAWQHKPGGERRDEACH